MIYQIWNGVQATKSKVKERASLFKEKVGRKLLSSINWIGIEQDYAKITDEGFYVTDFLFSESNTVWYIFEMCFEEYFLQNQCYQFLVWTMEIMILTSRKQVKYTYKVFEGYF